MTPVEEKINILAKKLAQPDVIHIINLINRLCIVKNGQLQ